MRIIKGVAVVLVLSVVICRSGFAQTGGHIGPSGGEVAAGIAAIVGGGVGITYLALHNRGTLVGCVQADSHGNSSLIDENKKVYALVASGSVPSGERVKVKGKKGKNSSGEPTFEVQHLVKVYGQCERPAAMESKTASGATALNR